MGLYPAPMKRHSPWPKQLHHGDRGWSPWYRGYGGDAELMGEAVLCGGQRRARPQPRRASERKAALKGCRWWSHCCVSCPPDVSAPGGHAGSSDLRASLGVAGGERPESSDSVGRVSSAGLWSPMQPEWWQRARSCPHSWPRPGWLPPHKRLYGYIFHTPSQSILGHFTPKEPCTRKQSLSIFPAHVSLPRPLAVRPGRLA